MIGLLGDIHGNFKELLCILKMHEGRIDAWLQVGDLGGEGMIYPDLPSNFYFIQGNHENWGYIRELKEKKDPHYIQNGTVIDIPMLDGTTLVVAGLGGNYSKNFYSTPNRDALPESRYRHYIEKEVEDLKTCARHVDILLTHEAPAPYLYGNRQIGQETISEVTKALRPKLHVYGHHHYHRVGDLDGVQTLCLGYGMKEPVYYSPATGEMRKSL